MTAHGMEESQKHGQRGYYLPAPLVNKLIAVIFGAILAIGGYMITWAVNDASYRSEQEARMESMLEHMGPEHPDQRNNFQGQITQNAVAIAVLSAKLDSKLNSIDEKLDVLLKDK